LPPENLLIKWRNHAGCGLICQPCVCSATYARSVFEFGCGTCALASKLLQRQLPADARYVGLDISSTMVSLAQERLKPWSERARVQQSDGSPRISEPDCSFDRFVSTYVFDLLAPGFIDRLLSEAQRLLMPGGKLCLVSMTFGVSLPYPVQSAGAGNACGGSARASWAAATPSNFRNICGQSGGVLNIRPR
jgi:SAM-dependent methyltransferase